MLNLIQYMVSVAGVAGFEPTNDGVRVRPTQYDTQYIVFYFYICTIYCVFLLLFHFSPKLVPSEFLSLLWCFLYCPVSLFTELLSYHKFSK